MVSGPHEYNTFWQPLRDIVSQSGWTPRMSKKNTELRWPSWGCWRVCSISYVQGNSQKLQKITENHRKSSAD